MNSQRYTTYILFNVLLLIFSQTGIHSIVTIALLRPFQIIMKVHTFSSNTKMTFTYIHYNIYILGSTGNFFYHSLCDTQSFELHIFLNDTKEIRQNTNSIITDHKRLAILAIFTQFCVCLLRYS